MNIKCKIYKILAIKLLCIFGANTWRSYPLAMNRLDAHPSGYETG